MAIATKQMSIRRDTSGLIESIQKLGIVNVLGVVADEITVEAEHKEGNLRMFAITKRKDAVEDRQGLICKSFK